MYIGKRISIVMCRKYNLSYVILYLYFCCCLCSSAIFADSPINIGRLTVDCNGGEQKITDCNTTAEGASSSSSLQFHLTCCKFITQCVYTIIIELTVHVFVYEIMKLHDIHIAKSVTISFVYQLLTGLFHCMEQYY